MKVKDEFLQRHYTKRNYRQYSSADQLSKSMEDTHFWPITAQQPLNRFQ